MFELDLYKSKVSRLTQLTQNQERMINYLNQSQTWNRNSDLIHASEGTEGTHQLNYSSPCDANMPHSFNDLDQNENEVCALHNSCRDCNPHVLNMNYPEFHYQQNCQDNGKAQQYYSQASEKEAIRPDRENAYHNNENVYVFQEGKDPSHGKHCFANNGQKYNSEEDQYSKNDRFIGKCGKTCCNLKNVFSE